MLVFDLHLDLAMNALLSNRDLTLTVEACRRSEAGIEGKSRGKNTVTFPEMHRGGVGLCIATVLARVQRGQGFGTGYRTHEIAYAMAQGMLAYYRQLERMGICRLVRTGEEVRAAALAWETAMGVGSGAKSPDPNPVPGEEGTSPRPGVPASLRPDEGPPFGFILGTEGADCIVAPSQLGLWWEDGLRVVSLVHYSVSKYAHGTGADGPLTADGRDLLGAMDELGAVLDITHQCDASFWESLERFKGPVIASHQNCRALVPGGRQMSDDQLRALIERSAIIGPALDNWMLYPGYIRGQTPNALIDLQMYVDHIDHICQLAGNARHVAIGSDLDGGYGYEQTPRDLNTIAALQKVPALLTERGYSDDDVAAIMGGNAVRFFERALGA
ncbi:MAG: membrane dipeptidase [Chloroflexi bacterium]|nr:membrane dipeptidase [Chloroflexota bacterium]